MQAPTLTSDFNCLPTDIITTIASTSGQVWRALARVNHVCSGTLSWKEFVNRFSSVGVVTHMTASGRPPSTLTIIDPDLTWIKLLDGVPHSEEGETWNMAPGTRWSSRIGEMTREHKFDYVASGTYQRGKLISTGRPHAFTLRVTAWEERPQ